MNENLRRLTAGSLVVIMLLVGFFAEYTHRHAAPSAGQPTVANAGSPPAGVQISHDCFICQLTSVAVEIVPALNLTILNVRSALVAVGESAFLSSNLFDAFLHRGPPAFFA